MVAAGAVCVPLNPRLTADEWQRYFRELRLAALIAGRDADSGSRAAAQALGLPVIGLSMQARELRTVGSPASRVAEFSSSTDDALILLTSGSTSRPKTVPLTHENICRSAYNVGKAVALGSQDRLLSVLPLFHGHGLISGVLAALAAGSSVVCAPNFDADAFFRWLNEFQPTWYTAVPAIHRAVLAEAERREGGAQRSSLRFIRSASSTLPRGLLLGLETAFGVPVIDTYGMTEAATQIAANPLGWRKIGSVGQPAGAEIAILNGDGSRQSHGATGEIALRGPTITRGYDNDAAATVSSFRDGWFRTGDFGYLDADGYLFIVGRIKDVIDRGGQKIAPAEVEEALLNHPDVADAVAFSVPHKRLGAAVAAAVVLRSGAKVGTRRLRDFVRERLAEFKVPSLIRIVQEIPKGPAGKINRANLVAELAMTPKAPRKASADEAARSRPALHRQLSKIWADLLELNEVGVDEDVFVLGADSLTLMQMLLRLRAQFGVDFSMEVLFAAPTVVALATRIESQQRASTAGSRGLSDSTMDIARVKDNGSRPMSIMQEDVLRIERDLPGLPQFNSLYAYRLQGSLDVPALDRSLAEVVHRHDSLRTEFTWLDQEPFARVVSIAAFRLSLVVENLAVRASARHDGDRALLIKKAELKIEQEALEPFDTSHAPLFRVRLLRLGADDHILVLVLHHIILDGWSMGVFLEELSEFYASIVAGRQLHLPAPALRFSDFAHWQRGWSASSAASGHFTYWKERLRKPSPVFRTTVDVEGALLAASTASEPVHLPHDLVARLSVLGREQGATLFMTLLAGLKALLLARSGCNDICIATAMANRTRAGTERVIGPFANTTLIRTRIDTDMSFQEALSRVREAVLGAHASQELPFDILAARLAEEVGLDPASLIQVFFVVQNAFRQPLKLPNVAVRPFGDREGRPVMPIDRNWLTMILKETPAGITGTCGYKVDLFEPNAPRIWIAEYETILADAVANPKTSLGRLVDR